METIHPIVVHFPIALLITATFISFLAILYKSKRKELITVLYWILLLGGISILIALFSGLYEAGRVVHNEAIHEIMEVHELLGYIITGAFSIIALWVIVRKQKIKIKELVVIAFLLLGSSSVLVYSAYLGGKMVYEQGAGVKPMEKMMLEMHGGGDHHHAEGAMHETEETMHNDATDHKMNSDTASHSAPDSSVRNDHNADGHSHDGHSH